MLDGSTVNVPMMRLPTQVGNYSEGPNYQALVLNYQPFNIMGMMVILPASGEFAAVDSMLNEDWFKTLVDEPDEQSWNVNLRMPRFELETTVELSDILADMGMADAFASSADFSGIVDPSDSGERLFVDFVIHQANISVDEQGTEAAAATALRLGGGGPPNEPVDFFMDRPFIYIIYHQPTGAILFLGRVLDPAG